EDAAAAELVLRDARDTAIVIGPGADRDLPAGEDPLLASWAPGEVAVSTRSEGFLLLSEVWHPGWRASIDGVPAQLFQADLALMGVQVPAGEHRVIFRFRPLHWPLSRGIQAISSARLIVPCLSLQLRST